MEKDKAVRAPEAKFAEVAVLLIFLGITLSIGIFYYLNVSNHAKPQMPITLPPVPITLPPVDGNSSSAPQAPLQSAGPEDALWGLIEKGLVERGCLAQAKQQAGDYAWAVRSCTCNAKEDEGEKFYGCGIGAIDGVHLLSVNCVRKGAYCAFSSEQGQAAMSFSQLAAMGYR